MSALLLAARLSLGLLVFVPIAGLAAHDAGAIRPFDCQRMLAENTRSAELTDPFIKGIVTVGMNKGITAPEAAAMLDGEGAAFFLPYPYREHAVVCVSEGKEESTADHLRTLPLVEWAHTEGVKPLQSENR
jgi:hypothetical protein